MAKRKKDESKDAPVANQGQPTSQHNDPEDPGAGAGKPDWLPDRVAKGIEEWNAGEPVEGSRGPGKGVAAPFAAPLKVDAEARAATEGPAPTHVVASGIYANDPNRPLAITSEVVEAVYGVEEVIKRREESLGNKDFDVADLSGEDRRLLGLYGKAEPVEVGPDQVTGTAGVGTPTGPQADQQRALNRESDSS